MKPLQRWQLIAICLGLIAAIHVLSSPILAAAKATVQVLCYHTFLNKTNLETDFSIDEFREHITRLRQGGFTFVSLSAVEEASVHGDKNILLMFDDGHRTAWDAYQQVMAPQQLPAVFAVYPGIIADKRFMSWTQLKQLAATPGLTIIAHGYWHEKLRDDFKQRHPREFVQEFSRSKQLLSDKLGIAVNAFVYPYGVVSESAKAELRRWNYRTAYGLAQKPLQIPLAENPDLLALPRTMMTRPIAQGVLARLLH